MTLYPAFSPAQRRDVSNRRQLVVVFFSLALSRKITRSAISSSGISRSSAVSANLRSFASSTNEIGAVDPAVSARTRLARAIRFGHFRTIVRTITFSVRIPVKWGGSIVSFSAMEQRAGIFNKKQRLTQISLTCLLVTESVPHSYRDPHSAIFPLPIQHGSPWFE
jgi:hypothetical protein